METIQERALRIVFIDYESTYALLLKEVKHEFVIHKLLKKYGIRSEYLKHCMGLVQLCKGLCEEKDIYINKGRFAIFGNPLLFNMDVQ